MSAARRLSDEIRGGGSLRSSLSLRQFHGGDARLRLPGHGGSANWKKVLGPVKSGKQASAKLPQATDCRFDLRGTFADGQSMDASGVNVCADSGRRERSCSGAVTISAG
jgi:hypothetical protein